MSKFSLTVVKDEKKYILTCTDMKDSISGKDWSFWLENELEEGMTLSEINLFDIIDKHWKESF